MGWFEENDPDATITVKSNKQDWFKQNDIEDVSRETIQPTPTTETKPDKRPQDMTALDKLSNFIEKYMITPKKETDYPSVLEVMTGKDYNKPKSDIVRGVNIMADTAIKATENLVEKNLQNIQPELNKQTGIIESKNRPEEISESERTLAYLPTSTAEQLVPKSKAELAMNMAIPFTGSAIKGGAAVTKNIINKIKEIPSTPLSIKKLFTSEPKIAEEARNLYKEAEITMKQKFGDELVEMSRANIGSNNIDVTQISKKVIDNLKRQGIAPSKIKKAVKDYPILQKIISSEEPLKTLKLGELQDLKNSLNKTFTEAKRQGKNLSDAEYQLYKLTDDIDNSILNHYEQYAPTKSEYSRKIKDLKILKGLTKEGKTFKNLKEIWNNKETREVLKRVFPEEFVKQFGNREKFNSFLKWGGAILGATAIGKAGQIGWNAFKD